MMFGYATNETLEYMTIAIYLAHKLAQRLTQVRKNGNLNYLRTAAIIKNLDLRRPIYKQTADYGHFGRNDLNLPWEELNKVDVIKRYL